MLKIIAPLLATFWLAPSLRAELNLCNSAPLTINAAFGYFKNNGFTTHGWYVVEPGACVTVLTGALDAPAYYVFGRAPGGKYKWGDEVPLCVAYGRAFTLTDCAADDREKFAKVVRNGLANLNHWFTCAQCIDRDLTQAVRQYLPWVEQVANQQAPMSYRTPGWQDIGPVDLQYGVSRGPFRIGFSGNRITLSTRLNYWISISHIIPIIGARNGLASCGVNESQPVADITLETIFGVRTNGKLHSTTRVTDLSFPTPCNLTMLDYDGRGYIESAVRPQLDRLVSIIDSQLSTVDLSQLLDLDRLYGEN